ncbi:MAG: very short patch repair endonuclease [Stellaceae bacterium]
MLVTKTAVSLQTPRGGWPGVPDARRRIMRAIRSAHTRPELAVRSLAHRLGFRFRLHRAGLPGKPDLVFPGRRRIVFVHGCFWHQHKGCKNASVPRTRADYWKQKLQANKARDVHNESLLREAGWQTLVLWECELKHEPNVARKLIRFLRAKTETR